MSFSHTQRQLSLCKSQLQVFLFFPFSFLCFFVIMYKLSLSASKEMYSSGRKRSHSKSNWLFGSGFPVLLGFMRVFRLREGTIFWRSLLQFSPKFSQNARRILKFNIWSITQVVVRGRTRNAIGRETGARVRLPDAPPNRMDKIGRAHV